MKKNIKETIIYLLISLFFSLSINLKLLIDYENTFPEYFIIRSNFDLFFFIKVIAGSFICYFILLLLIKLLSKIKTKEMIVPFSSKVICSISFIGILISNIIFLLTYYPGSNMYDTFSIIQGPISSSNQHPIIYNLLLSGTFNIFNKIFNNMNIAYFLTSIIQTIFIGTIITYVINWFNKTFKNKTGTIVLLIYFIFLPIVSNYNTVLIKDSIFASILLLHIPLLYKLLDTKGECLKDIKYLISMLLIFISTILVRNNGIYVILFLGIIIFIIYKKYLKYFISTMIVTLIISQIPNLFIVKNEPLFQEKIAIPIQQLAYTIKYDENTLSSNDLNYLNKIMDIEKIKENYNPYSVDTIKWNDNFNREYLNKTKGKFAKVWLHNLPSHFTSYVKSYILTTYELWSIEKFNPIQSRFLGIDKTDYYNQEHYKDLNNKQIFPNKLQNILEKYYKNTVIFFGNGSCFWILLILCALVIYKEKKELILLTIPFIGIWITLMISSPISYAFRYMCPYLYALPFLIYIIFNHNKKESI